MSEELPIDALRDDFDQALDRGHVVVAAATGSGKSTRLPVWARRRGRVLVVEPRRVACMALADHLARQHGTRTGQDGTRTGQDVGYAIRFDPCYGDHTEILFATPGVVLRWLEEGSTRSFETIILDEFHERRQDTDLLLALLATGGRHRLVITSATLAARPLADWLDGSLLESEGRSFDVAVRHLADEPRAMPTRRDLESRVRKAVQQGLKESSGDILVFLPGRGEIRAAEQALADLEVECQPLHAGVSAAGQRRALRQGNRQRVILATNVAETSLTIPGVTAVVDTGLERRTGQRNGRTVLTLAAISRANAEQRAGRAGRTAPGICLRLWGRQAPLERFTPPEVQREQLTEMMLAAAAAGENLEALRFPDPLPEKSLTRAREQLEAMKALDGDGRITDHGRALFALPIDTLFAHLITAMPDAATCGAMADLTAALSTRPRLVQMPRDEHGRRALQQWQPRACDATTLIAALRDEPPRPLRTDPAARREARSLATQIRDRLGLAALPQGLDFDHETLLHACMRAAPELVFVRREKRRHALGNGFGEITVAEESRFDEEAEAALVFDDHSVPGRQGTRQTLTLGTCLAPVPLAMLDTQGLGEERLQRVRWEDHRPVALIERDYAGRVIARREQEPRGETLLEALVELILRGSLLQPAGERLRQDLHQWALYVSLGHDKGPTPEARDWLRERLQQLGVESADDVALLEPEDLRFDGIPEWERARFDEKYPARLNLADLVLRVHYEARRRQITVEKAGGRRKGVPKRWELPAWQGWKIQYRDGSRVVDIR